MFAQNERHNGVGTFASSEERYQEILAKARQLERELVILSTMEDAHPANRVYQFCMNLFPVSNYTDD